MILYYIRHGDPIYTPDGLTELGKRQAEAVAKRLAVHGIDEIYASTSNRAKMTATPLSEIIKKPICEMDWCNEAHAWGELSVETGGKRTWIFGDSEIRKKFRSKEILKLGNNWYADSYFSESIKSGIERINKESDAFLEKLGYIHDTENGVYKIVSPNEKRIALFAHQGVSMAFLSHILDIPYPIFSTHFDITHTGVSVIRFGESGEETVPIMLEHSNDSHLYREGLPTKYNNQIYI